MVEINELKEVIALRTYATESELPEVIKLLVGKALVEEIIPHIIQVQFSDELTGKFEVILWGN